MARKRGRSKKQPKRQRARPEKGDRRPRHMRLPTRGGFRPITVRGSRQASILGRYTSAVGHFLKTGDSDRLRNFEGKKLNGHALLTDPEILTELAQAGALQLDELYVHPEPSR